MSACPARIEGPVRGAQGRAVSRSSFSCLFATALASGASALLILSLHTDVQGEDSCSDQIAACPATSRGASDEDADLTDPDGATEPEPGDLPALLGRGKLYWEIGEIARARLEFARATRLKRRAAELRVEEL